MTAQSEFTDLDDDQLVQEISQAYDRATELTREYARRSAVRQRQIVEDFNSVHGLRRSRIFMKAEATDDH